MYHDERYTYTSQSVLQDLSLFGSVLLFRTLFPLHLLYILTLLIRQTSVLGIFQIQVTETHRNSCNYTKYRQSTLPCRSHSSHESQKEKVQSSLRGKIRTKPRRTSSSRILCLYHSPLILGFDALIFVQMGPDFPLRIIEMLN